MHISTDPNFHPLARCFADWVTDTGFPCVGAKSALARSQVRFVIAADFGSDFDEHNVHRNLVDFASDYKNGQVQFQSLVVLYEKGGSITEEQFEAQMWSHLNAMTGHDERLGLKADHRVSSDPDDPHFSLSFGGEAFFIVGLHAHASRPARRFIVPAIVFNIHDQFEQLRVQNQYEKMRSVILARDEELSGSVNPMLAPHGTSSAARQYSGRRVDADWVCPFAGRKDAVHNERL